MALSLHEKYGMNETPRSKLTRYRQELVAQDILETEGFQTFLQGTRGKPRGNPCGYYSRTKVILVTGRGDLHMPAEIEECFWTVIHKPFLSPLAAKIHFLLI